MLGVGALGGIAALLVPILTGQVLAEFIPRANVPSWSAALVALMLLGFGNAVFSVRDWRCWHRGPRRRAPAGRHLEPPDLPAGPVLPAIHGRDLAARANGISHIRRMLTGAAVQAAISGLFSMFSLALLFYYHWLLALYVCIMLLGLAVTACVFSYGQVRHYRDVFRMQGAIDGFVLQMINGVAKLRVRERREPRPRALGAPLLRAETSVPSSSALGPRHSTQSPACSSRWRWPPSTESSTTPARPAESRRWGCRLPVVQRRVRAAHGGGQQPDDRIDDLARHHSAP